jgi:hypothetical protein
MKLQKNNKYTKKLTAGLGTIIVSLGLLTGCNNNVYPSKDTLSNENTKKNEYKKVLEVFNHKNVNDNIYSLTINNTIIEASSEHPFYVKADDELKLVEAKDLKIGDIVINSDGNCYPITQILVNEMISGNLYNIKVEDNHNYYVSSSNILVHNKK